MTAKKAAAKARAKGTIAEADAKKHNAQTGSPKPVSDKPAKKKSDKAQVQVTLDVVEQQVLDNLRGASSRHEYLQAIVGRHLEAANPVASFQEEDDLPGNEREVKRPNFRV